MMAIHIGTSGWSYNHWKENFYPPKLKTTKWLDYYASVFSTVEINTTFYRMPLITTIQNWHEQVPSHFTFSIKASRYITHQKKLKDCAESLTRLYDNIQYFKSKAGVVLFQLPPSFKLNQERLIEFIAFLNHEYQYVFEFRHPTWFCDDIYALLTKNKIALCITDLNGALSPEVITGPFTYIRLHGPKKAYQGSYGGAQLNAWKRKIEKWDSSGLGVYCYFDNDEKGYAIQDAMQLQKMFV
ncbi:MAG: DUF72 domain-containing protein [Candidatus Protochlamydia sp.]|nr:DUF72 domain-containing protein [Candidatus Protochlamydia sp.]